MASKITQLTADTSPTTDDLIVTVNDPTGTPTNKKVTLGDVATFVRKIVQVVNTETGAVNSGSTIIPYDDTIPQNTEGDEFMTLAITPTNASNKLKIEVVAWLSPSVARFVTAALFQDSTANALAAMSQYESFGTGMKCVSFTHYMTAGTTSSTTFKVRGGCDTSGTTTFNGQSAGRKLGGVAASSITITEIVP
jgi:hypothetical protein